MTRLSCSLCPLASRRDLLTACRLRPDLARVYAELEARIGHRFQHTTSMRDLIAMSGTAPPTRAFATPHRKETFAVTATPILATANHIASTPSPSCPYRTVGP